MVGLLDGDRDEQGPVVEALVPQGIVLVVEGGRQVVLLPIQLVQDQVRGLQGGLEGGGHLWR